jgi:predicted aspartyl protease
MRVRKLALVAAVMVSGIAGYASADQPGSGWMTKEQVMQKLSASGYSNVTGLEADDGHWEGKGTKNGQIMEFHVDPHSGALTKEEIDD